MRKVVLFILLTATIGLSITLLLYSPALVPSNNSPRTIPNNGFIELKTYSGWKGVESTITPLDEYVKSTHGSSVYFSDLLWPLADAQNPFHDLLDKGSGVVTVTVLSVERVYRYNIYAYIVYEARVNQVIVKPQNTIEIPPQTVCVKDPAFCDSAKKQHEVIKNLISTIRENNTIELIVPAFITKESINKTNLTINNVATPFPLLEPGYQYLVFLDPELDGIHVHFDYVWGLWAYLVLDGEVYSLNYVKPPSNISLNPSKLFESPYIHWKPYPYEKLREIATQKLSVNGEQLKNFILKITRG
ncbi:MAG: hypothetical protein GSR79_07780 [Desulfurococcales archaeon]|nr:hypothetical protein [Desulfurococcales archaeon]